MYVSVSLAACRLPALVLCICVLQACEDWLYEEGEDCTKSVYVAKLAEMQALGGPVQQRAAEDEVCFCPGVHSLGWGLKCRCSRAMHPQTA